MSRSPLGDHGRRRPRPGGRRRRCASGPSCGGSPTAPPEPSPRSPSLAAPPATPSARRCADEGPPAADDPVRRGLAPPTTNPCRWTARSADDDGSTSTDAARSTSVDACRTPDPVDPASLRRPGPAAACRSRTAPSAQVFTAPDGKTYRPSMFVTLTLPSYGKVIPGRGVPVDPARVRLPARRAGRPALLQAGRPVGAEPAPLRRLQGPVLRRRRTPTPPRPAPARRHPRHHPPRHRPGGHQRPPTTSCGGRPSTDPSSTTDRRPGLGRTSGYRDPDTGCAAADLGAGRSTTSTTTRTPGRRTCMRFGQPGRHQGPRSAAPPDSDRAVRYLTKYLTKAVAETYADPTDEHVDPAYEAHIDRLHDAGALAAVLAGVRELAALRRPAEERRPRADARARARPRRTTASTSASAAAASSSPAAGPARPSPSTAPTAPPSSAQSSRPPASTPPTRTGSAAEVLDEDGQPRFVWADVPRRRRLGHGRRGQRDGAPPLARAVRRSDEPLLDARRRLWTTVRQPLHPRPDDGGTDDDKLLSVEDAADRARHDGAVPPSTHRRAPDPVRARRSARPDPGVGDREYIDSRTVDPSAAPRRARGLPDDGQSQRRFGQVRRLVRPVLPASYRDPNGVTRPAPFTFASRPEAALARPSGVD